MEGKTSREATCITLLGTSVCFLDEDSWLVTPAPVTSELESKSSQCLSSSTYQLASYHPPLLRSLGLGSWNLQAMLGPLPRRIHSAGTSLLSWLAGEPLPPPIAAGGLSLFFTATIF